MTNQISILNTQIRTFENLYCLNDLHLLSGAEDRHQPNRFIRLDTTKELINEMMMEEMNARSGVQKENRSTDLVFKTLRGRNIQGTYACEELALAYATWISPKFHLIVLRAFLAMHKNQALQPPQQPALPEPTITPEQQRKVQKMVDDVNKESGISHAELYSRLKNKFRIARYDQLPQTKLRDALIYLAAQPFVNDPKPLKLSLRDVLPLAAIIGTLRRNAAVTADSPILHHGRNALHKLVDALPEPDQTLITDLINP